MITVVVCFVVRISDLFVIFRAGRFLSFIEDRDSDSVISFVSFVSVNGFYLDVVVFNGC